MHFICIYLLALLHIFEYTKKTELYPAIGKEELFQMLYSKNKKRGFTLVELIVVLVILAILAALLIPALTGYIDKAKKDQVIAETRMLHEAIQTEMVELYGSNTNWKTSPILGTSDGGNAYYKTIASKDGTSFPGTIGILSDAKSRYEQIAKLSEVPSLQTGGKGRFFVCITSDAKIHAPIYDSGRGYLGVYFRDTQQYQAYTDGEKTSGGNVAINAIDNYYGHVYYNQVFDAEPVNGKYTDTSAYMWSCEGLRATLQIDQFDPSKANI